MSNPQLKRFILQQKRQQNFWSSIGLSHSTSTPNDAVHQGFLPIVYKNILAVTSLSQVEFQDVTHIPLSTIKRRLKNGERFNTIESDAMYRLAMLINLANELFQCKDKALEWIRQPVYGLNGKRPLDMISTSVDFEIVKDLIGRVEHGVFS